MGAFPFLFRGLSWLNDENGLSDEENASRVEELGENRILTGQIWREDGRGLKRTGWAEKSITG